MILIADDHAMVAESLAERLRVAGYEASVATTGADLLELGARPEFQALILDVRLHDEDGLDAFAKLRAIRPTLPTVVLTGFSSTEVHERAAALGIAAVLSKTDGLGKLLALLAGLVVVPTGGRASVLLPRLHLSASKIKTLDLVASGHHASEIARAMGVTLRTAEETVSWLMHRLGAKNRAHLVTEAIRHGFPPPPAAGRPIAARDGGKDAVCPPLAATH